MNLVWCPDRASKAYIDTVKLCGIYKGSSVKEFISAMAAGWNAKLIVEVWSPGGGISTSIGLAVASRHTNGRHVCILSDERSKSEYEDAMAKAPGVSGAEIVVGEAEDVMRGLTGVEFLVVDCRRNDVARVLRNARLGNDGSVLVCKNASSRIDPDFQWRSVINSGGGSWIVRSVYLPVGKGLDIAHVAMGGGKSAQSKGMRWIDRQSGEEHVIWK